jgi:hypothetical protein
MQYFLYRMDKFGQVPCNNTINHQAYNKLGDILSNIPRGLGDVRHQGAIGVY